MKRIFERNVLIPSKLSQPETDHDSSSNSAYNKKCLVVYCLPHKLICYLGEGCKWPQAVAMSFTNPGATLFLCCYSIMHIIYTRGVSDLNPCIPITLMLCFLCMSLNFKPFKNRGIQSGANLDLETNPNQLFSALTSGFLFPICKCLNSS